MKERHVITRRDFLKGTAGLLAAAALPAGLTMEAGAETGPTVVAVRNERAVSPEGRIDGAVIQSMLDEAVATLTGKQDPSAAWKTLFAASDIVGIKTNAWRYLPTPREVEASIERRVLDAGVSPSNISIDDRGVLRNPVFQKSTALVNTRPLRTHHWSGVGTCLKNYIMFVPSPSEYHPEGCSDLGKIWTMPNLKGKTRLNVLVALTPQFYGRGANFFDKRYVWPYKGLIVGTDPVAVDAVGAELLRLKRTAFFGEDKALDVPPVHITAADRKFKVGVSDLRRIRLVKLGWKEEALL
jgi:hypothetical protein